MHLDILTLAPRQQGFDTKHPLSVLRCQRHVYSCHLGELRIARGGGGQSHRRRIKIQWIALCERGTSHMEDVRVPGGALRNSLPHSGPQ